MTHSATIFAARLYGHSVPFGVVQIGNALIEDARDVPLTRGRQLIEPAQPEQLKRAIVEITRHLAQDRQLTALRGVPRLANLHGQGHTLADPVVRLSLHLGFHALVEYF